MVSRHLANEICRGLLAVGKWLGKRRGHLRNRIQYVRLTECQLSVLGTQMASDLTGVSRLVIFGIFEPDGECLHGAAVLFLHQRNDQRRIYTTRKKRTQRYVRERHIADGSLHRRLERLDSMLIAKVVASAAHTTVGIRYAPVGRRLRYYAGVEIGVGDRQNHAGAKLADALIDRVRGWDICVTHE